MEMMVSKHLLLKLGLKRNHNLIFTMFMLGIKYVFISKCMTENNISYDSLDRIYMAAEKLCYNIKLRAESKTEDL